MLYISIKQRQENEIQLPDVWVKLNKPKVHEWLKDSFVQEMILDIDKIEVVSDVPIYSPFLYSPILGVLPLEDLSTGLKNLLIGYGTNLVLNASKCGDNCSKWLYEISKKKDLYITLYHIMKFPSDLEAIILNTGDKVKCYREYHKIMCEYF